MQHILHRLHVGFVHRGRVGQVAFALGAFLGQNMTVVGMLPFDFSSACKRESFFGARFGF